MPTLSQYSGDDRVDAAQEIALGVADLAAVGNLVL
jgi:hypothetical protein